MATLRVEVVLALPGAQEIRLLALAPGATADDAVRASGLLERLAPGAAAGIGIHGRRVAPDRLLASGDRVEIYRALRIDPRQARRRRAVRRGT